MRAGRSEQDQGVAGAQSHLVQDGSFVHVALHVFALRTRRVGVGGRVGDPKSRPRTFLPNSLHKERHRPGSLPSGSRAASVTTVSQGLTNWLAANLRQPIWGSSLALLAASAAAAAAANSAAAVMDDGPHVAFVREWFARAPCGVMPWAGWTDPELDTKPDAAARQCHVRRRRRPSLACPFCSSSC